MSRRADTPFNNPFVVESQRLRRTLRDWRKEEKRRDLARRMGEAGPPAAEAGAPDPPRVPGPKQDEAAFRQAMAGVVPLPSEQRVGAPRDASGPAPSVDPDAEAYALLADLVAGSGPFDIADTVEHVEGLAAGVDRRLLRRLRRGEFSLQGHVDLHGLNREEARAEVERFVERSRALGKRCILIVHGRGLNSKDQLPVLKPALVSWLSRGRLGRRVLAFATARPADGGAGALYVLLRK